MAAKNERTAKDLLPVKIDREEFIDAMTELQQLRGDETISVDRLLVCIEEILNCIYFKEPSGTFWNSQWEYRDGN